jgi:hypothetical protein
VSAGIRAAAAEVARTLAVLRRELAAADVPRLHRVAAAEHMDAGRDRVLDALAAVGYGATQTRGEHHGEK